MSNLLARLIEAGTDPALVAEVAMEIGRLNGLVEAASAPDAVAERRREWDREYRRERRANQKECPPDVHPTPPESSDIADTPPALDKETSPRPPKEINLTPRAGSALARKAAGLGPPAEVSLETWNAFCTQRKKPLSKIAFNRMQRTLAEAGDAGWPPGEIVERSIEKAWETLYVPTERRNGNHVTNRRAGSDGPRTALAAADALPGVEQYFAPSRTPALG